MCFYKTDNILQTQKRSELNCHLYETYDFACPQECAAIRHYEPFGNRHTVTPLRFPSRGTLPRPSCIRSE
jgi:hypothetical protein